VSIDRRSFVQSVAAAAGTATSLVAADAGAQSGPQYAEGAGSPRNLPPPPSCYSDPPIGPYKPPNYAVGDQAQRYYAFLKDLFDPSKTLRNDIWKMTDKELRDLIRNRLGLKIESPTRIMIVDIGNGRTRFSDNLDCSVTGCAIPDPASASWYTLVLPPLPLGYQYSSCAPEKGYLEEMTWESAWHHAVVYGYGM
jgi:hypothetical protein